MRTFVVVLARDNREPDVVRKLRHTLVALGRCDEAAPGVWFLVPWQPVENSEQILEDLLAFGVNRIGAGLSVAQVSDPAFFGYPESILGDPEEATIVAGIPPDALPTGGLTALEE